MKHLEYYVPFLESIDSENLLQQKTDSEISEIVCQNCGWHWDVKDGGDDLYVCHDCNTDNSKYYINKNIKKPVID